MWGRAQPTAVARPAYLSRQDAVPNPRLQNLHPFLSHVLIPGSFASNVAVQITSKIGGWGKKRFLVGLSGEMRGGGGWLAADQ
jgi:hypothetical protein